MGEEKDFHGVVDLVAMKAITFRDEGRTPTVGDVPTDMAGEADAAREALIELVAEADDSLMEQFFEAGTLTQAQLEAGLKTATADRHVFPLVCTSATANVGIQPLLDTILTYVQSPAGRVLPIVTSDGETSSYDPEEAGTAALVWKTVADPFAGRITLFRVACGSLKSDSTIHNVSVDVSERVGTVALMQGKKQESVAEIKGGDLGTVAKLKDTRTGNTLAARGTPWQFAPFEFTEPVLSKKIPQSAIPGIRKTSQLLLSGQGQLHIEVTVAKLKRRFGVTADLKLPRIPYRETIKVATEAHGRHKKQTGGHGQFGDCKIKVAPLSRGADFQFIDEIFGGAIPRGFIPAVEKGIQEARTRGYLAGYPMVDFSVTLYDGSFHSVDSNEMSFKMAGRLAFRDAMSRAKPTLLEPVMNVEVYAPSDFAGDLMGDLNGRRGRIVGMETRGASTSIKARVPMSEMLTYEQQLTSSTGGRGSYHMEFSHYDEVPAHIQDKVIAAAKAEAGQGDEEDGN
ncbi:Elongation factor G [Geodia barretti]|uniref:Elongation factor G n=1 Tax=Geodia barretti TaxID=519541 RepID=A0AA35W5U5_GEOBA|nr:Elongation factor G [Geodia barretti]